MLMSKTGGEVDVFRFRFYGNQQTKKLPTEGVLPLGVSRIWIRISYFLIIFPNRPPRSLPAPEAEELLLLPPSREPSTLPMLLPAEA